MNGGWLRHPWRLRAGAVLLALVLAWLPALLAPQGIAVTEGAVGDAFWRFGASTAAEHRVVVVDIDERSLAQVGHWPWPRQTMAQISQRLAEAGALVQAYDIAFADERDGDAALRDAWSATPVVAAQLFSVDRSVTPAVGVTAGAVAGACPPFAPQAHGYYGTSATLLQAHPAVGHITPQVESDGVVRKLPALICRDGRGYVSLPLATLWLAAQAGGPASADSVPDWQWHMRGSGAAPARWLEPATWLTSPSLPGLIVPLDGQGHLRVPYGQARSSFTSVSAVDLLQGRADMGLVKGALVIVGATAFGLGDTVSTPHGAVASGVEVHAQTLVGLLDNRIPYTPARWPVVQALGMVLLAAMLLGLAAWQRVAPAKRLPLAGAVLAVAIVAGAAYAQLQLGLWLPWLQLALFTGLASIALATVEHALARAQGERLSAHLGAYLPRPVAQRLMVTDPSGSLQVDHRNISVMVADIRNFSAFAAHHPPEETAALLQAFLCIAVDVVEQHGGVVDNVIGDSVLAVWNASPDCADHPVRALAAARELCRATLPLLQSRKPISEHSPVQPLALGVGLESGAAIVGSFGPARRRAHAALGEPVSVANRIQQMTTDLSMPILVGPQLAALLPSNGLEPLGEYLLEGMGKHYRLFAPTGWAELVTIDPNWASSAVATCERSVGPREEWSRWGQTQRHDATPARGALRALAAHPSRSA